MSKAVFYHAGCPVCVDAEQTVLSYLDASKVQTEVVHLGTARNRIEEAEKAGVKSVPALVINGSVYHINFGASLDDVKNG
ncbi:thioredoxin family protein [Paenibacillus flagellatus]|uniref:Thioredoxin family protein n=1 Tax=Paenibacillus flagellatus TaxID=2211139 RepID=A0A2V5KUK4_9BACL|nr:thioredoxin family protein [Paenibacillus flagellatus]PYI55617.1 thioredoxin family protein [Paenibacillus flagellatus]